MTSRPRLARSVPFWVLFLGSLALTGFGAWMVFDRLTGLESAIRTQPTDQADQLNTTVAAYVAPSAATIGGLVLGAGLVGLLLTLAVAVVASLLPRPAVEVVEAIDWSSEDESALDDEGAPAVVTASEPVTPATASAFAPAADAVVSEDPDVETPSDAPAPARADDDPVQR